jgi:hypothetical protein
MTNYSDHTAAKTRRAQRLARKRAASGYRHDFRNPAPRNDWS